MCSVLGRHLGITFMKNRISMKDLIFSWNTKVIALPLIIEGRFLPRRLRCVKLKAYQADIAFLSRVPTDRCSSVNVCDESRIGAAARIQNTAETSYRSPSSGTRVTFTNSSLILWPGRLAMF